MPAAALAPAATTSDPVDPTTAPQPSATQDPGAKKTAAVWNPIPFPSPPKHDVPSKETDPVPIIEPQVPRPQPTDGDPGAVHQGSAQQGSSSTDPEGQPTVQSSNRGDPDLPGNSIQDASKEHSSPAQKGGGSPARVVTSPVGQQSAHNANPEGSMTTPIAKFAETTFLLASHAVVAGPSGVHVDGVEVSPNQDPTSISGVAAINEGSSIVVASQIYHIPAPTEQATTMIAGQKAVLVANGVSILGTSITGTSSVIISGTTVSVDKTHIYFGSKVFPLPIVNPASVTTLANGAVALPLSHAISIYGTTLTVGAPAATFSGTTVSLDASSNLIFDGTSQALPSVPQTTSVLGSEAFFVGSPSESLGGLIMGGLGHGRPSANGSSPSGSVPTSIRNSTSPSVHTFEGKAGCLRMVVAEGLACLAVAIHLTFFMRNHQ